MCNVSYQSSVKFAFPIHDFINYAAVTGKDKCACTEKPTDAGGNFIS